MVTVLFDIFRIMFTVLFKCFVVTRIMMTVLLERMLYGQQDNGDKCFMVTGVLATVLLECILLSLIKAQWRSRGGGQGGASAPHHKI